MTGTTDQSIPCPVCRADLDIRHATGRKSGKPFLMFICAEDGRHFRGFITHQGFMEQVLQTLPSKHDQGQRSKP